MKLAYIEATDRGSEWFRGGWSGTTAIMAQFEGMAKEIFASDPDVTSVVLVDNGESIAGLVRT